MKKRVTAVLSVLVVSSLVGCSTVPSDKKIMSALEEGTITVEDAKARGWIDDAWVEAHFETVESGTKIHGFDPFETTYLDGTPVSSEIISGKMCLVFFDTSQENTMDKLEAYNQASSEMNKMGIPVLGIVTDKDLEGVQEKLKDMNFPMIVFNEEVAGSLEKYKEMIATDVASVFTRDGGFYSSWNSGLDQETLLKFTRSLANEQE